MRQTSSVTKKHTATGLVTTVVEMPILNFAVEAFAAQEMLQLRHDKVIFPEARADPLKYEQFAADLTAGTGRRRSSSGLS